MIGLRVVRYAESQARIRARLGTMPSMSQWRYITQAADIHNLIERMRTNRLGFWLSDLPREPDAILIEECLRARARLFINNLQRLLPANWVAVREWWSILPDLSILKMLLHQEQITVKIEPKSLLRAIADLPKSQRRIALQDSPYGPLVSSDSTLESLWWDECQKRLPDMQGREATVVLRIKKFLREHVDANEQLRLQYREIVLTDNHHTAHEITDQTLWVLRNQLSDKLRTLLAGDPFHAGMALIYGLLEAIQFERLRALLLTFAHHWHIEDPIGVSG